MQLVLSAAGAVVGGVLGGPMGAQIGWMAGGLVGGLLFPPKPPAMHDLTVQNSAYGQWIPTIYATFRVSGNVIWCSPVTVTEQDKKKAPVQAAQISMAIGLCAGPITAVKRIWANHKLIYDISNPSNFQAISGSESMVSNFTVYYGDETQLPDPTMESYLGVGNVPAHRGLAYVVFNGLNLLPYGNVIPTFEFEVTTLGTNTYYSSVIETWTPFPGQNGAYIAPYITAQGAKAFAYLNSGTGLVIDDMTAYGVKPFLSWPSANPNYGFQVRPGNSDVAIAVDNSGYWDTGGQFHSCPGFASTSGGIAGVGNNMCVKNQSIYLTSTYTSGYPIYRVDSITGNLQATSTLTGCWQIIGCSNSYLYAATNSVGSGANPANIYSVYQFDALTLAAVNSWNYRTNIGNTIACGAIGDDDHIYVQVAGGLSWVLFRPSQNTWTTLGQLPFNPGSCAVIGPNLFMFTTGGGQPGFMGSTVSLGALVTGVTASNGMLLSQIVADICNRAGLSPSQYDASQLTDIVYGYAVTTYSSARDAIKPLMDAFFFDAVDSGGVLRFVKRGSASAVVIPWADLGAARDHTGSFVHDPIQQANEFEQAAPRSLTFNYKGKNNDYLDMSQRAFRSLTQSNQDAVVNSPIVFDDGEALTRAQAIMWAQWLGLKKFQFTTTLAYLAYEPTDVVGIVDQNGYQHNVRLTRCAYDGAGVLQWDAELEYAQIYPNLSQFNARGAPPAGFTKQTIDYSGPSVLAVLDVPPLRDADTSPGLYLAACGYASSWPGISIEVSRDGTSYSTLTNDALAATIGVSTTALPNFTGGNQPDELSTVTVQLYQGALSSVGYTTFLSGVNCAYLGGELIVFRNATQLTADTYQLSGLLRGRAGTEWAMSTHAAGERFVFLDSTKLINEPILTTDIGNTLYFEYQLLNIFYTLSNPFVSQKITNGRVKPLSPALFKANPGSAASVSDISLSWLRRARVSAGWLDGTDVPLDESSESYQLQILNGTTVVRTVVVTGPFNAPSVPAYTYTAAQITADGFTTGNTIKFSVAQNSDQGVLGYAATTSIVR
ncbi:phage tail protein [Burkholderia ubonensis]|uniref:phage tail protein n=1 Tax=Burkholderia ubonensis TaxID=101571 RepID=UPI0007C64955|nr:phage tail protein [Burkholderia ubonensis]ODQ34563.1 hypothetical protein BGV65_12330 [Burkholderia ubonensis]